MINLSWLVWALTLFPALAASKHFGRHYDGNHKWLGAAAIVTLTLNAMAMGMVIAG
ncbi:MAG: hypothetical protein NUW01_04675 [Gemmatimonadaceae bacterium]|nr:hypothetical protein [Gemmatimonadaceae bacterium]